MIKMELDIHVFVCTTVLFFFDFSAKVPGVFHVLEIIKNLSELNTEFERLISDLTQDINCQCTGMHQVNPTGSFQKIDR